MTDDSLHSLHSLVDPPPHSHPPQTPPPATLPLPQGLAAEWKKGFRPTQGWEAVHSFIDRSNKPCWTWENAAAYFVDAGIEHPYTFNRMFMHNDVDPVYHHGKTPECLCASELSTHFLENIGLSGRFVFWSDDGTVGRDMLSLGCKDSSDEIYSISIGTDAVYRRVFGLPRDSPLLGAGDFRDSPQQEMIVLCSRRWPHAVFVSQESSTVNPHGTHPALCAPGQRRACFGAALLGGNSYAMYGTSGSLVETLARKTTMARLDAILKDQHIVPPTMELQVPSKLAGKLGGERGYAWPCTEFGPTWPHHPSPSPSPSPSPPLPP